jgi:Cys-rich repeat protein
MIRAIVTVGAVWSVVACAGCSGAVSQASHDAGAGTTPDGGGTGLVDGSLEDAADGGSSDGHGGSDGATESGTVEAGPQGDSGCPQTTVSCVPASGPTLVCAESCPGTCTDGLMMCCMDNGFGQCACFCSDGCGGPSCAPPGEPVGTHHCNSAADCACNEQCGTGGICLPPGFACSTSSDCQTNGAGCPNNGAGYTCQSSLCVPPGWTCTNDADCGSGKTCSAGTCQ